MTFPKTSMMLTATIAMAGAASAQTAFVFESEASVAALNGLTTGSLSEDGITLSVSATAPVFTVDEGTGVATFTDASAEAVLFVSAANGIGVDNPTITNEQFEAFTAGPAVDDTEDGFITGLDERLVISFDQAVIVTQINFFGVGGNETVTVEVSSLADAFSFVSSTGDVNNNPFGEGVEIAAGETISFGGVVDSNGDDPRYSLESITVTAVPEPASLALLGLGGLAVAGRRRRA